VNCDASEKAAMLGKKRKGEMLETVIETDPAEGRVTPMTVKNDARGVERMKRRSPR
jgi:hypothetical protein